MSYVSVKTDIQNHKHTKMLGVDLQKITNNKTQIFRTNSGQTGRQNSAWKTR